MQNFSHKSPYSKKKKNLASLCFSHQNINLRQKLQSKVTDVRIYVNKGNDKERCCRIYGGVPSVKSFVCKTYYLLKRQLLLQRTIQTLSLQRPVLSFGKHIKGLSSAWEKKKDQKSVTSVFLIPTSVLCSLELPLLKDRQRFDAVSTSNLEVYKFLDWWI